MHYGFIGRLAGFSVRALETGAGLAQFFDNFPHTLFPVDTPEDRSEVNVGMYCLYSAIKNSLPNWDVILDRFKDEIQEVKNLFNEYLAALNTLSHFQRLNNFAIPNIPHPDPEQMQHAIAEMLRAKAAADAAMAHSFDIPEMPQLTKEQLCGCIQEFRTALPVWYHCEACEEKWPVKP